MPAYKTWSRGVTLGWPGLFSAFVLLNLADLQLTRRLFDELGTAFEELNPLAGGLLSHFGWRGLTWFKLGTTFSAALLLALVSLRRPRIGRQALTCSCALLGGVVLYSYFLNLCPYRLARDRDADVGVQLASLAEQERLIQSQRRLSQRYEGLVAEVLQKRCRPTVALARALEWHQADPRSMAYLRHLYRGCSDRECLGLYLLTRMLFTGGTDPAQTTAIARELADAYETLYGARVPRRWWEEYARILCDKG